ncbi:25810_t:CDS:1, partial [Gigaspora rosea]
ETPIKRHQRRKGKHRTERHQQNQVTINTKLDGTSDRKKLPN